MSKTILDDPRVKKLIASPDQPRVENIVPLKKDLEINSALQLWYAYDLIREKWLEAKSYSSNWWDY